MKKVVLFVLASVLSAPVAMAEWTELFTLDNGKTHWINPDDSRITTSGYVVIPTQTVMPGYGPSPLPSEVAIIDCLHHRFKDATAKFIDQVEWKAIRYTPNNPFARLEKMVCAR